MSNPLAAVFDGAVLIDRVPDHGQLYNVIPHRTPIQALSADFRDLGYCVPIQDTYEVRRYERVTCHTVGEKPALVAFVREGTESAFRAAFNGLRW